MIILVIVGGGVQHPGLRAVAHENAVLDAPITWNRGVDLPAGDVFLVEQRREAVGRGHWRGCLDWGGRLEFLDLDLAEFDRRLADLLQHDVPRAGMGRIHDVGRRLPIDFHQPISLGRRISRLNHWPVGNWCGFSEGSVLPKPGFCTLSWPTPTRPGALLTGRIMVK